MNEAAAPAAPATHETPTAPIRRIRVCYFNTWVDALEPAANYLKRVRTQDLVPRVSTPADADVMRRARLDCDWYGENTRCFASMAHPQLEFLPAWVCGPAGLVPMAQAPREPGEERWLISSGQEPQTLGAIAGKTFALLARGGIRHLLYSFDEASRYMACFREIAPHLNVLIHDECPLDEAGRACLRPNCRTFHHSWVANMLPYATPFNETPEDKILFLGSEMGFTPHRKRQIDFLHKRFGERFEAFHDHSVSIAERGNLNRFKVSVCPEGRKFTTQTMNRSHTDRPYWSGCLGLVPVSENSKLLGRLDDLHRAGLIMRYPHADLEGLASACERALAMGTAERRRIYDYYNCHETVGAVTAAAIFAAGR